MSQSDLQRAKNLIQQGKYEEARLILITMQDNPIAQKWLTQIQQRLTKPIDIFPQVQKSSKNFRGMIWISRLLRALSIICLIVGSLYALDIALTPPQVVEVTGGYSLRIEDLINVSALVFIATLVTSLFLYIIGGLIHILLAIEENTRK